MTDPHDSGGALIPQLHGLVGWLAALDAAAFDHVLRVEPLLLVSSDAVEIPAQRRGDVVMRLLDLARNGELPRRDPLTDRMLKKLAYPTIATILTAALAESSPDVRLLAMELAVRCSVDAVAPVLIDIALNPSEPAHVRIQAIRVAGQIASTPERSRLRALLDLTLDDDPSDEYRGAALTALWPAVLSADELLTSLRHPQRPEFFGLYASFLRYHAARHWNDADIPKALQWLANVYEAQAQTPSAEHLPAMETFGDSLVLRGWDVLDDDSLLPFFAAATIPRLRRFGGLVTDEAGLMLADRIRNNPERRRTVVEAILHAAPVRGVVVRLAVGRDPLVGRDDVTWLLARIKTATSVEERDRLVELIRLITSYGIDAALLEELYVAAQESIAIAEAYHWLFEGIARDSHDAVLLKEEYEREQRLLAAETQAKATAIARAQTLHPSLVASESGDPAAFRAIVRALAATCPPNSLHPYEVDLRRTLGWSDADDSDRARIVDAAYRYLAEGAVVADLEGALAAARALFFLMLEDKQRIHEVTHATWERWMPTLFAISIMTSFRDLKSPIMHLLYLQAREAFLAALVGRMTKENAEHGSVSILADLDECWDAGITATVANALDSLPLTPAAVRTSLAAMLQHDSVNANPIAVRLLGDATDPGRRVAAATAVWLYPTPEGWAELWKLTTSDAQFADALVTNVMTAPDLHEALTFKRLTEDQLAELYLWLNERYPRAEDPPPTSGGISARQQVSLSRDAIIDWLAGRATSGASRALRAIVAAAPDTPHIQEAIRIADALRRDASWQPLAPPELLRLAADRSTRVVRNADQLLAVVLEALDRLEEHFHGKHSPVLSVWNETSRKKKKVYSPKDELAFSRRVAEHFEVVASGRRLVVNREVEIRRGQFTDIIVDAFGPNDERFTVVIECKGCWHREVRTAIETQLVNRYLRNLGAHHGVYLIGFYHCPKWPGTTHIRKKAACPGDRAQLDALLRAEAQRLSIDRLRIRSVVIDCMIHD